MKARAFVVSKETGEPISGVAVTATWRMDGEKVPVALLASDEAGYVSFDVADQVGELFLEASPGDVGEPGASNGHACVQVKGAGKAEQNVTTGLSEDPVVLAVDPLTIRRPKTVTRPAVQSPDVRDWELSPTSFVTRRSITLGEGGCAVPVRSVLPLRRIRFVEIARQPARVVLRPYGDDVGMQPAAATGRSPLPPPPPGQSAIDLVTLDPFESPADTTSARALPCTILEYEQEWTDLGETLGNILYSLPLAPCESVDVAVIEAARQDQIQRHDDVTSREELDHSIFRDRTIDESVEGALRERQGGWSLMGGMAGSYSGSWANVGTFSAVHSLGGAISHSWGNRDVEAESNQELHDAVVQATDVVRSLNSTVVVAASQTERHQLETRTVTNHNHCHALTVQYYEVLRRAKLTTSFLRARPGILIPYEYLTFHKAHPVVTDVKPELGAPYKYIAPPEDDDLRLVNRLRPQLEGSLLEPRLDANFEAVRNLLFFSLAELPKPSAPVRRPGDYDVETLVVGIRRGQWGTGPKSVSLRLRLTEAVGTGSRLTNYAEFDVSATQTVTDTSDPTRVILPSPAFEGDLDDEAATESLGPWTIRLRRPISRLLLAAVEIHWTKPYGDITPDFSLYGVDVRTPAPTGEELLVDEKPKHRFQQEGSLSFAIAPPKTESGGTPATSQDSDTDEARAHRRAQDEALAWELITHLYDHRDYYSQRIVATKDSAWFAEALDKALPSSEIRDHIDGTPIAVSGRYVAFTTDAEPPTRPNGKLPKPKPTATDIVSLPTRGVLAEAQLGSCNACEKRDVTRFWQWEESPCERPPEIQGITPGFRGQTPQVTPQNLPNAVVQITQPPAAPDPVGLAAALNLLGKGDAFRDMSGLPELQQLLSGLASGAVDLAKAKDLAKQVQAKQTAQDGGASASPARQTPADRYDGLQVVKAARDEGLIGNDDAHAAALDQVRGGGGGGIASLPAWVLQAAMGAAGPVVTSSDPSPSVNQDVVLTVTGVPPGVVVSWSGGGTPPAGSGATFTTRFPTAGSKIVTASWTPADGGTVTASTTLKVKEPSGAPWHAKFPDSKSVDDLADPFRTNVKAFLSALKTAGAAVTIDTTLRPAERVYLMHWAYKVANGYDPATVPPQLGVDIGWLHRRPDGTADPAASKSAAAAMVAAYGIVFEPSLNTHHKIGRAIDMKITWTGTLTIVDATGTPVSIATTPRTGADNTDLHKVGATFGVKKLVSDAPHWSDDGH
jgi:hypothetical protein